MRTYILASIRHSASACHIRSSRLYPFRTLDIGAKMTAVELLQSIATMAVNLQNVSPEKLAEHFKQLRQIEDMLDDIVFCVADES